VTVVPHYIADTNILLRFLTNDHVDHGKAAQELVRAASDGNLILVIPYMTLSETVFTLRSFYKCDKKATVRELQALLNARGIKTTAPAWIKLAFELYSNHNITFGDACIAAEAEHTQLFVASFDTDFDLLPNITRFNPLTMGLAGNV